MILKLLHWILHADRIPAVMAGESRNGFSSRNELPAIAVWCARQVVHGYNWLKPGSGRSQQSGETGERQDLHQVLVSAFERRGLATIMSPDCMVGSGACPFWISSTLNFAAERLPLISLNTSTIEFASSANPPALTTYCRRVSPLYGENPGTFDGARDSDAITIELFHSDRHLWVLKVFGAEFKLRSRCS